MEWKIIEKSNISRYIAILFYFRMVILFFFFFLIIHYPKTEIEKKDARGETTRNTIYLN